MKYRIQMTDDRQRKSLYSVLCTLCSVFCFLCSVFCVLCYTQSAYGAEDKTVGLPPNSVSAEKTEDTQPPKGQIFQVDEYIYNPTGKVDPFRSVILGKKEKEKLEEERKKIEDVKEEERFKKELENVPMTPLQEFDVSSIKVVAIMWGDMGKYALVEAPDGKGYTIKRGTYIGKGRGIVKKISDEMLTIEEKYIDVDKKIKTRIVELKLKKGE